MQTGLMTFIDTNNSSYNSLNLQNVLDFKAHYLGYLI